MVMPLWKAVLQFLTKIHILLPYHPSVVLLGIQQRNWTYVHIKTCTQKFITALFIFIIAKTWKPPTCPSVGQWINKLWTAAAAKLLQSCPTLCNPIDGSPPGSPVPGILQARTVEWVVTTFSNAEKWKVTGKSLSRARLLVTPWIAAHQAPLSMGFSRQEYWSGMPLPSPKLWTKEYYSALKRNELSSHDKTWRTCKCI